MGYCYGYNPKSGKYNLLSCDSCGNTGGVRRRKCPYTVAGTSLRSYDGQRHALPYCPPPALCAKCFKDHGGTKGIHGQCKVPAAESQASYDAEQARLDAGELQVVCAYGDWHDQCPKGLVLVDFAGIDGTKVTKLVASADYHGGGWLSDFRYFYGEGVVDTGQLIG